MSDTRADLQRRLVDAIRASDVVGVERALADGADANAVVEEDVEVMPLLVLAAEKGDHNVVRLLLLHGADMKARAYQERQSMFHDDTTYQEDRGDAVKRAIDYDRFDVVEYLLQRGASADDALPAALSRPRFARLVLERGANPNGPHLGECITNGSVGRGKLEGVRLLLEYGADPNQIGWGGKRVLLNAIEFGRLEEARALLAAGATPPTRAEVEQALDDAWLRSERPFRERALATAHALGFDVTR